MDKRLPSANPTKEQVDHVCPSCNFEYLDDCLPDGVQEMLAARAKVVLACGYAVVAGPILLGLLSFISTWFGKQWNPDDRLMLCYIGAFGLIAAWAWKADKHH